MGTLYAGRLTCRGPPQISHQLPRPQFGSPAPQLGKPRSAWLGKLRSVRTCLGIYSVTCGVSLGVLASETIRHLGLASEMAAAMRTPDWYRRLHHHIVSTPTSSGGSTTTTTEHHYYEDGDNGVHYSHSDEAWGM